MAGPDVRRLEQRVVTGPAQKIVQQGGEPGVRLVVGVGLAAQDVQKLQNGDVVMKSHNSSSFS